MKKESVVRRVLKLPRHAWGHWLGIVGIVLATAFGVLTLGVFLADLAGFHAGPYSGLVTFFLIPAGFVASLALIALGGWLSARRERGHGREVQGLPVIDFNLKNTRRIFLTVAALTIVNLLIVGTATYKGVHYMDSVQFCGKTCHSVMEPEYVAYSRSPHSRVRCVECHIGPGAPWFVKSKISGSYQVISVMFDLYPRPIPVPVHSLRPARETCEQCHWPEKFHGKRMRVHRRYETDEENSRYTTVLMMNIGGISPGTGEHEGIHWHVNPDVRISYYSADKKRMEIPYVLVEDAAGRREEFVISERLTLPEDAELRVMDCIDCHNRPTHIFDDPSWALDEALESGRISPDLPCAKRAILRAVERDYPDKTAAGSGIAEAINDFYEEECVGLEGLTRPRVKEAIAEAVGLYNRNIYPRMKIEWNTYPNHIGHTLFPGCFRCHDDEHASGEGNFIFQDCDLCHTLVAMEEEEPEVLEELDIAP